VSLDPIPDPEADPERVARAIVLQRLNAAPRTRAELAGDLAKRLVPADVADQVLDRFVELGFIDDAAFAEAWVNTRHTSRGLARRTLQRELQGKGIDSDLIVTALQAIDDDAEFDRAVALVERKWRSGVADDREKRRLFGMLARKGYPSDICRRAVAAVLDTPC
jgi:regulatory protein